MKTSENITVTDARLRNALKNEFNYSIMPSVDNKISQVALDSKMQLGVMTKFYPYLDKCEVKINNNKLVLCKILHRFTGNLMDFFTPDGEDEFCDKLKEPCIIPRGEFKCLILDVNDNSNEQVLLGFVNSEKLIGFNPARKGNLKLVDLEGTNQYWIKFGGDGLDVRLPDEPSANVGDLDEDMSSLDYVKKGTFDDVLNELNNKINNSQTGSGGFEGDFSEYVKKSDVSFNVINMDNGYLNFNLNIGE